MLLNILRQTITEYNLFDKGDKVLIGLSGGADSVCLTHALSTLKEELGIDIYTAHLNHGIRGIEAERDEKFAYEFSMKLGIKCFTEKTDIPALASKLSVSEETAARKYRYNFFERVSQENGINKIATAHNKNDNAETILMNFMRGSSLQGLCGIPYKRDNIVRPLLNVKRTEIEQYCNDYRLEFVTDSTNLKNDYTRNKIRNILIPRIENDFNSNLICTLTDNADLICEDNNYLNKCSEAAYSKIVDVNSVDISALHKCDVAIQRRVVMKFLVDFYGDSDGISSKLVNDILSLAKKQSGKSINIMRSNIVKNEYGKLFIESKSYEDAPDFLYSLNIGETCRINEIQKEVIISECSTRKNDGCLYLDNRDFTKLILRSKKSGDKFYPSGMNGGKKIKEYFINNKIPKEERKKIPVIELNGEIAAVGKRVDERFLFKDKGIKIEFKDI